MAISIDLFKILIIFWANQLITVSGCNGQVAHCAPCGQVEIKCGSKKTYFRICYYISKAM